MIKFNTTARRKLGALALLTSTLIGLATAGAGTGSAATLGPDAPDSRNIDGSARTGHGRVLWFLRPHNSTRTAMQRN